MESEKQSETFELRLEARLKNAKLVRAREQLGLNQEQAAEAIGISKSTLGSCETLKSYPCGDTILKIISFYNLDIDEVFPKELKKVKYLRRIIAEKEIPKAKILTMGLVSPRAIKAAEISYEIDPIKILMREEKIGKIGEYLDQLNPREVKILKMKYGLGDREPRTYKEIGLVINLSGERVRQIEKKSLEKIYELSRQEVVG